MARATFSGALMPKKKSELQDISVALRISDEGTKEDLHTRIKEHLNLHPDLEENPTFSGLFVKGRKRSVQPSTAAPRCAHIIKNTTATDFLFQARVSPPLQQRNRARAVNL